MPRVFGDSFLHVSDVHTIVEADEELPELACPAPTEVERAIAEHVVRLVPEHGTLQLGIGGVPDTPARAEIWGDAARDSRGVSRGGAPTRSW